MSSLIIEMCKIDSIEPHPNGDFLDIAQVKGWKCVVRKGQFQQGDDCIYFPPDTLLPKELSDELGVTNYLKSLGRTYPDRDRFGGRVSVARLRGTPSLGLVVIPHTDWLGHLDDLGGYLGVEKYEPPEEVLDGDAERTNVHFHKYTDMENLRNFPNAFGEDEIVVATEKIHGRNVRIGLCYENEEMVLMAGSHGVRRRRLDKFGKESVYWRPLALYPQIETLLWELYKEYTANVVLYGEIYGAGMQDLTYGQREVDFRVFDIAVNTTYLSFDTIMPMLLKHKIPMVPMVSYGPFNWTFAELACSGDSVVSPTKQIREGIVIRPIEETLDVNGRKIYKLVSFDYLNRKGGSEDH